MKVDFEKGGNRKRFGKINKEARIMVSINLRNITSLFISILLALSLVNTSVFAQNSSAQNSDSKQSVYKNETGKVLELGVLDTTTGEIIGTKLLLKSSDIWDESILSNLDEKYLLVKNELRSLQPGENLPQLVVGEDGIIKPFAVETIFDIGNFVISLGEFIVSPNLWTGFNVITDGLAVVFPGVPSVNGVKRMIGASSTLKDSLKVGVKSYGDLTKDTVPTGWQRHHIFEKRFKGRLGSDVTDNNMLAIPMPSTYHQQITSKMRSKIPYGSNLNNYTKSEIIDFHIDSYHELWDDTQDEFWEFMYEFSKSRQYKVLD